MIHLPENQKKELAIMKVSLNTSFRSFVFAASALILAVLVKASYAQELPGLYRISVPAGETEADMATQRERFPEAMRQDLELVEDEALSRFKYGYFVNAADARVLSEWLGEEHNLQGSIVRVDALSVPREVVPIDPFEIVPPVFALEVSRASQLPHQRMEEHVTYDYLESLDNPETRTQYKQELIAIRPGILESDILSGYIDVNIGILQLLDGQYPQARASFEPIANGEVTAAANHRLMAMWRLGWLAHQEGDKTRAYRYYTETQRFADSYPRTVARCIKERTGLIFEMAKDEGAGQLADVRRFVESNRALVDPIYWDDRATVELMYLETFYYEARNTEFLRQFDYFYAEVDPRAKKQIATALVFKALAEHGTEQEWSAYDSIDQVLQMDLAESDRWQAIPDLKVHAAVWGKWIAAHNNNQERYEYFDQYD